MPAVHVADVHHRYGGRAALAGVSFDVREGEIFCLVGLNGSGKTTLFRLLSTLMPLQQGVIEVFGADVRTGAARVRAMLGVVFQAPSLDKHLTIAENLKHHGRLHGIGGLELTRRIDESLKRVGLADRAGDRVNTLSGGLRRRAELAQGMMHEPRLLILDEPSTGLDPAARSDMWRHLNQLRDAQGTTIVVTTHLLEEAEKADRIGIFHRGKLVALDTPASLKAGVGGDSITMRTCSPEALAAELGERFRCSATVVDGAVRLEQPDGASWAPRLFEAFGDRIQELTIGKPTLEDVFIERTGHRFFAADE